MTPRPEDVALLRRVADLLPPISYEHTAAELRSLASRLEGERRDTPKLNKFHVATALWEHGRGTPGVIGPIEEAITAQLNRAISTVAAMQSTPTTPSEDRHE